MVTRSWSWCSRRRYNNNAFLHSRHPRVSGSHKQFFKIYGETTRTEEFLYFSSTIIWQSLQFRLWNYSAALQCYCIIMVLHYQKPLALVEAHNFEQQQQEHFFQQLRTGVFFYIWPAQWLGLYFYQIWFMQSYFLNLIIRNFLGF